MNSLIKSGIIYFLMLMLTACAGQTLIKKRNLQIETKMSDTIFLEPVAPDKRIVFVDIRNTSDKPLNIESNIRTVLNQRGFTIIDDPSKANFMLQVNVLQVGKTDLREASSAFAGGYGGALLASSLSNSDSSDSMLVGGVIGFVADAMVEDIFFSMITDIQVRERPLEGEVITQSQNTSASQGTSTSLTQSASSAKVNWKIYRTRILSTANKVNLEFSEAQPVLESGLSRSIGGIF